MPHWLVKSALLKNFKLNANSTKPRKTLIEFKLNPLGKLSKDLGKLAVSVKTNANDNEKPSIPIIGFKNSPSEDNIKTLPTIGAVHEKLIKTRVKAMKNIPIMPPWSAFLFILFKNELGRVISKAPKKDKANMKNIKKNIRFAVALVANAFNADAPSKNEKPRPSIIKINIMDNPYITGPEWDCLLLPLFVKNETVKGIIGNTHGVKIAANPAKKAPIKKLNNELESVFSILFDL